MKTYTSKNEIYRDFAIALKFALERPVHVRDYENIFDVFSMECKAKVSRFSRSVKNFNAKYPISSGFFVEVTVTGDTGQKLGVRFVLLEHETGWELFAVVGKKIADKVTEEALSVALARISAFMKQKWSKLIRGGVRIDHVEIRTKKKGVMLIPFSNFDIGQVRCLMKQFPAINHLSECNNLCFGGMLVEPSGNSQIPQAND